MSSDVLESAVKGILTNDYVSLALVVPVIYDYLLIFSREVEYIWCRPWTWVSCIFLVVRYVGFSWAIVNALDGSALIPSGQSMYCMDISKGIATFLASYWEYPVFFGAVDLVMILRVYAMWNQSKVILYSLLLIYVIQLAIPLILGGVYFNYSNITGALGSVAGYSFCNYGLKTTIRSYSLCVLVPRLFLSTTLFVLATVKTVKSSIKVYRVTKRWQPNRYMELFAREGTLYFLMNVFADVISTTTTDSVFVITLDAFALTIMCIMIPRFIVGMREMYDIDSNGRRQGIDTGFGVSTQLNAGQHAVVSAIAFAGDRAGQARSLDGDEDPLDAIQLEDRDGEAADVPEGQGSATDTDLDGLRVRLEGRRVVTNEV